jgi:hypothetical protein
MDDATRIMFQRLTVAMAVLLEEKGVASRTEFAQFLSGAGSFRGDGSQDEGSLAEADTLTFGLAEGLKPANPQH